MNASLAWLHDARGDAVDEGRTPPTTADVVPIDEETGRHARLVDWLTTHGATTDGLAIAQGDDDRGVRATADLAEGMVVARIPPQLFVTTETTRSSRTGRALAASGRAVSERAGLAAFLVETRRDGGFFAPYVDALPRDFAGHPLTYGPVELMALDPRSALGGVVMSVRDLHRADAESVADLLAAEGFTRAEFDWAYACVRTRAYDIGVGGAQTLAMIPLADMLNHVDAPSTRGIRSPAAGPQAVASGAPAAPASPADYVITTTRAVAAGEEVTATYGQYGNVSLLAIYGFCLADNPHDSACLIVGDEACLVPRQYAHADVRAMFRRVRLATPALLSDLVSLDMNSPCGIEHEFACLDTLYRACETTVSRFVDCRPAEASPGDGAVLPAGAQALIAAVESEKNVVWHLISLVTTAGRVLRDRGHSAQDRALLAYIDADYAAEVLALVDSQGRTDS